MVNTVFKTKGKTPQTKIIEETRREARNHGLTLKDQGEYVNNKKAFMFVKRETNIVVAKDFSLWEAYEFCLTDEFEKLRFK